MKASPRTPTFGLPPMSTTSNIDVNYFLIHPPLPWKFGHQLYVSIWKLQTQWMAECLLRSRLVQCILRSRPVQYAQVNLSLQDRCGSFSSLHSYRILLDKDCIRQIHLWEIMELFLVVQDSCLLLSLCPRVYLVCPITCQVWKLATSWPFCGSMPVGNLSEPEAQGHGVARLSGKTIWARWPSSSPAAGHIWTCVSEASFVLGRVFGTPQV